MLKFALVALGLLAGSPASAQDWFRLDDVNLTEPSASNAALRRLWAVEIARNDKFFKDVVLSPPDPGKSAPAFAASKAVPVPGGTLLLSVLLTAAGCETGSNDFRSESNVARCPARTAFLAAGSSEPVAISTLMGCYVAVNPDDPRASEKMVKTGVFAIRRNGSVEFATAENGVRVTECDLTLKGR